MRDQGSAATPRPPWPPADCAPRARNQRARWNGSIGFWIIAHDAQPERALLMQRTWLCGETSYAAVAQGTPSANDSRVLPLALASDAAWRPVGSSVDGSHMRAVLSSAPQRLKRKLRAEFADHSRFIRAKLHAMLARMCLAPAADFVMIVDDDTAVHVGRLRAWLGRSREARKELLYAGAIGGPPVPSIGGGPGILFSRHALARVCAALPACEACIRTCASGGGDGLVGHCANAAAVPATLLNHLFSKWPPWVRVVKGIRSDPITHHRVQPSLRAPFSFDPDPRCAIIASGIFRVTAARYMCAPWFALVGGRRCGVSSLMRVLARHPDVLPPFQKSAKFDHAEDADADARTGRGRGRRGSGLLPAALARHPVLAYARRFPHIDPRAFKVTGEASPDYLYHVEAARFFGAQAIWMRSVIVLRHPVDRWLSAACHNDYADMDRSEGEGVGAGDEMSLGREGEAVGAGEEMSPVLLQNESRIQLSFEALVIEAEEALRRCQGKRSHLVCESGRGRFDTNRPCCVPSKTFESFYELFLPPWLALGNRTLLVYSEHMRRDAAGVAEDVATHLQLPLWIVGRSRAERRRRWLGGDHTQLRGGASAGDGVSVAGARLSARASACRALGRAQLPHAQAVMAETVRAVAQLVGRHRAQRVPTAVLEQGGSRRKTDVPAEWWEPPRVDPVTAARGMRS